MMPDTTSELIGLKWWVARREPGTAQVRFRVNKRLVSISTGKKDPKSVTQDDAKRLISAWFQTHRTRWVPPTSAGTLEAEIERFLTFQYANRAARTKAEVRRLLGVFAAAVGVVHVHELTKARCEAARGALLDGRPARYQTSLLTAARKFCRWQVEEGNLPVFPLSNFKNPSRKAYPVREEIWTEERCDATAAHLRPSDQELFAVLRWTGMDPADLHGLTVAHLVRVPFLRIHKVRAKAKSPAETISQPVSSRVRAIFEARLEAAGAIGSSRLWPELPANSESFGSMLLERVKRAQRSAGFSRPLDLKALRHTFATHHARRYIEGTGGPPMEELRRWMGHAADSRVLERLYVHAGATDRFMD